MKCNVCGKEYSEPSLGGPGICPRCDCGLPPEPDPTPIMPVWEPSIPDPWPLVQECVGALRKAEWGDKGCEQGDLHCPICGRPDMAYHKEDCILGNALAHAGEALKCWEEKQS